MSLHDDDLVPWGTPSLQRDRIGEASYVALAEALGALLLTADIGLSRARGLRCRVELLTHG